MGMEWKGSQICLQMEFFQEGGYPQDQLLRVQFLCGRESSHVAGDGAEGIEQGSLHTGLQE